MSRSSSSTIRRARRIGDRRQATEAALAAVKDRLGRADNLDVRIVSAGKPQPGAGDDGTRLFEALNRAMTEVPRQRLAGVVMITDGQVHDVPTGDAKSLVEAVGAPLHVLLSGRPDERDRRLIVAKAPSFGLVGKDLPLTVRVEDLPTAKGKEAENAGQARLTWRKDGGAPRQAMAPVGRDVTLQIPIDHGGPNVLELEVEPGPRRTDARQQPRRRRRQRRARPAARAARLRRAACRRAGLAQHPQIRSVGRSRAFHDPAAAGKAGRHADPRIVADRLPDPRIVRRQARRFRPDHLRPLQPARRDPADLSRKRRALCPQRRRLSRSRGAEFRHAVEPRPHAARARSCRPSRPATCSRRGSSRNSPISAAAIR